MLYHLPGQGGHRLAGAAAIKYTNIVQPEKTSGKDILSLRVLAVNPPVEIQHQSLKGALQKGRSARPNSFSMLNRNSVAQACTGGFTSLKFHS